MDTISKWTMALTIAGLSMMLVCIGPLAAASNWQSRVSSDVLAIYNSAMAAKSGSAALPSATLPHGARFDAHGRVQVDVHFDCSIAAPKEALTAAGLTIGATIKVATLCVVEGWVAPTVVPTLAGVSGVKQIKLPVYASHIRPSDTVKKTTQPATSLTSPMKKGIPQAASGPVIDGNAITIMRADQYITQTGANGAGVKIAVMSDDVTSLAVIQSRGELPAVQVITPTGGGTPPATPTDEGTMMLEEVYAVAPGAALFFCGPGTSVEYVSCLQNLISSGATIIVDDLAYSDEDLMSSTGQFALAVQSVISQNSNISLFTVTENYNGSYWEGGYAPTSLASYGYAPISCPASGQTDYYVNSFNGNPGQILTVYVAGTYPVTFQWADPYGQNVSNFDVYWYNTTTSTTGCVSAVSSTATYFGPSAYLDAGTYDLYVMTPDASLAGKFLKLWIGGNGDTGLSDPTSGSIVSPQAFVPGVITVGAVNGSDGVGNTIESYSGRGPINLVFPTPTQIPAPGFVAPDAIYVDAVGTNFAAELGPDGFFHGTSAAAPNAAAVAALLLGAFPNMTPAQLTNALQSGAVQLGSTVPDGTFGYGRVDAINALNMFPGPGLSVWPGATVTGGSSTSAAAITATGFGALHFSVTSSNPALIPASLVAAGKAGVTLTPATCGNGTTACMVSVTPAIGQIGTATVTLIATDGGNRIATSPSIITVTKPPPPILVITSGLTQSVNVNTAIAPVSFTMMGTGPLTVTPTYEGITSVTITSGCGTTTMTCTANLGNAQSTAGTQAVILTVADSYGQSVSVQVVVTVSAPATTSGGSGSGGGALNPLSLAFLASIFALRRIRGRIASS